MNHVFRGKSADEHLEYIYRQVERSEDRWAMVAKLLETVHHERESTLAQAQSLFEQYARDHQTDPKKRSEKALLDWEKGFVRSELQKIANPLLNARPDWSIEAIEKELEVASPSDVLDKYRKRVRDIQWDTIDHQSELVEDSSQRAQIAQEHQRLVTEALDWVTEKLASSVPKQDLIFFALHPREEKPTNTTVTDPPDDRFIECMSLIKLCTELDGFEAEVRTRTVSLEQQDEIYSGDVLTSMKINWTGSKVDCKLLFDFLKKNGYIQTGPINKFLERHFLFEGKSTTAQRIGGFHLNRDGTFAEVGRDLKIPGK